MLFTSGSANISSLKKTVSKPEFLNPPTRYCSVRLSPLEENPSLLPPEEVWTLPNKLAGHKRTPKKVLFGV